MEIRVPKTHVGNNNSVAVLEIQAIVYCVYLQKAVLGIAIFNYGRFARFGHYQFE